MDERFQQSVTWWREHVPREVSLVLAGGAVGALLAFLFDPQLGRRRRVLVRDRIGGTVRSTARQSGRTARAVRSYGRGYGARVFHRTPAERRHPDDATLARKLETELFRPADVPKGQINLNVQDGVVQLRGEVPRPELIEELVEKARRVSGVRDVESLLRLPGVPPPMHQ